MDTERTVRIENEELAPGLRTSTNVPRGKVYVVNADGGVSGVPALDERFVVMHPDDWRKIAPADRERLIDLYVRESAEVGTRALRSMLASL